ncbi:MAG: proton extrusion protein PcxA [Cyanophyceae cyanobacterium]
MFSAIRKAWVSAGRWYETTPGRSLDYAYDAALAIQAIENQYFDGQLIDINQKKYGSGLQAYFRSELSKNLEVIDVRLLEFRASRRFFGQSLRSPKGTVTNGGDRFLPTINTVARDRPLNGKNSTNAAASSDSNVTINSEDNDPFFITFKKLEFIDRIRDSYDRSTLAAYLATPTTAAIDSDVKNSAIKTDTNGVDEKAFPVENSRSSRPKERVQKVGQKPIASRTSILPRSLLTTLDRVRRDLDDRSEAEIIENYRTSKARTIVSLKFVLLLILVPLLTQQVCKNFLAGPVVDQLYHPKVEDVFLNPDMEEEALIELEHYRHLLEFRNMAREDHNLTETEIEEELAVKAIEVAEESIHAGADAIKNIVADFLSVAAFALVIVYSREEIAILKSFVDEIMYGLSDSAKAFIIILSTDIFVGYHSTHGWEVVVGGISRHLGLPENRDFMFLFIATFPVILDAVIKYWIFRYLNRISPSAVATYKDMNE